MQTILVTGGAGFIGSNFIRFALNNNVKIINLDALTYAGNLDNTKDFQNNSGYNFIKGDICDLGFIETIFSGYEINGVINFAAESHVDRSIINAIPFVKTNVEGTLNLLSTALKRGVNRYLQVSTDEVYGSLGESGKFSENTPLAPNSPYSASKAGADMLVRAFVETYKLDAVITRCSNNYGAYQYPEKLIPLMITNAINDKELPVYGDGLNVRDWLHVQDHAEALWRVYENGAIGEVYNIGGECEKSNIDIVKLLLSICGKSESLISYVKDREGHDRRYAMDISKIRKELAWEPRISFEVGLKETVDWYINNSAWIDNINRRKHNFE